ncbi:hypothetical protein CWI38_0028p0040 [Hamiltosporidium tvaerminnensis]|uniref:Uncharacterized protein n=4 Tax=Hamiltosporidium TaxID=1176354 RepID=A0A4Q9LI89_9MICR|nr:hypothetical protein CWI39_0256p0020 [Hamiltosporidium magnivora]TBU20732.1 hypothetical protein CWI38_0028p0040 [Hamiltosporidium tvaerminnensis]
MNFLFYFAIVLSSITEKKAEKVKYEGISDKKYAEIKGGIIHNTGILLRASADKGGSVHFNERNEYDEWSFEVHFKDMDLSFPSNGGLYVWYTDDSVEEGNFNGGSGKFVGLMAGIEFLGKSVDLVLGHNKGDEDFSEVEDFVILRDSPNPERFRNVKELSLKVISTKKNFKIEIYDLSNNSKKIIYDNLRFTETSSLGERGRNKYFTITTRYDKVPMEKGFEIISAVLYNRAEADDYDPFQTKAEVPSDEPRMPDSIYHPNKEIKFLIANLEHHMKYIKMVMGNPTGNTLMQFGLENKKEISGQNVKLEQMYSSLKDIKNSLERNSVASINSKINDIDYRLSTLHKEFADFRYFLKKFEKKHGRRSNVMSICVVGVMCAGIVLVIIKEILRRKTVNEKYSE